MLAVELAPMRPIAVHSRAARAGAGRPCRIRGVEGRRMGQGSKGGIRLLSQDVSAAATPSAELSHAREKFFVPEGLAQHCHRIHLAQLRAGRYHHHRNVRK
jgi:hypothetical protein